MDDSGFYPSATTQLGGKKRKRGEKQGTPSAPGEGDARGGPATQQARGEPGGTRRGGETSKKAFVLAKTPRLGQVGKCFAPPSKGPHLNTSEPAVFTIDHRNFQELALRIKPVVDPSAPPRPKGEGSHDQSKPPFCLLMPFGSQSAVPRITKNEN